MINYINTNLYGQRFIKSANVEEYINMINTNYNNPEHCLLEILSNVKPRDKNRMYFDIEKIPVNQPYKIFEIIDNIYKECGLDKNVIDYALTFNENSISHEGLSYHLFINVKCLYYINREICVHMAIKYNDYCNYFDTVVYGKNRLFRSVGALNPKLPEKNKKDFHKLIHGKIEDTIIQNIENLQEFNKIFNDIKDTNYYLLKEKLKGKSDFVDSTTILIKQNEELRTEINNIKEQLSTFTETFMQELQKLINNNK